MGLIKKLVINIVISAGLLYLFNYYAIGIKIELLQIPDSLVSFIGIFLVLGFIFRVFNSPIKRILKALSCPINFLTLGLLSLVINVLVFYLFQFAANLFFDGEVIVHLGAIWQTVVLSFIMAIGISILKKVL